MQLVATILDGGWVYAVYADEPIPAEDVFAEFTQTECGRLIIPARFRLVPVSDEAPPARLAPDLSESLHGG